MSGFYAKTAYDSRRDGLPPDAREAEGGDTILGRSMRKYALAGRGVQCREYLALPGSLLGVEMLRTEEAEIKKAVNKVAAKEEGRFQILWATLRNPRALVETFMPVMVFVAVGGGIMSLLFLVMLGFDKGVGLSFLVFFLLPILLYKLGRLALDRDWLKDKHNVVFDRQTGLVEFTWKGRRERVRFAELEAGVRHMVGYAGNVNYHLFLYHRATGMYVQEPRGCEEPWEVELQWEWYQQFMDVSRPFPDEGSLEPFRHLDPLTAEFDHRLGRPTDYWKRLDEEEAKRMWEASRKSAASYPWGLGREQAQLRGWRASGFGEGAWCKAKGIDADRIREALEGARAAVLDGRTAPAETGKSAKTRLPATG